MATLADIVAAQLAEIAGRAEAALADLQFAA